MDNTDISELPQVTIWGRKFRQMCFCGSSYHFCTKEHFHMGPALLLTMTARDSEYSLYIFLIIKQM